MMMMICFLLLCLIPIAEAAHLSPFSYLERGFHQLVCFSICVIHIFKSEGFYAFNPRELLGSQSQRLKFLVMAMLLGSQFLFIVFDFGYCAIFKVRMDEK